MDSKEQPTAPESALGPTWMVYRRPLRGSDSSLRKWERFSSFDSALIEEALKAGSDVEIDVHFGRYTANPTGRWIQANYWKESKWPIVRGTWFWKDASDGTLCPFGEADAATMEEAFQDISTGAEEGPIDCELVDTDIVAGTVQFVRETVTTQQASSASLSPSPAQTITTTRITHALYRQTLGSTRVERLETYRGYPVEWVEQSEEKLGQDVSHLVLAVHGIGEALYNRQNDPLLGSLRFRGHCDLLRENLNTKLVESGDKTIGGRIEVLPVEWSECIHNNTLDRRMESVTIPNLVGVRDFANLALSDVFLYTQQEIKERISKFIKIRIKTILKKFSARNPDLNPIISFFGHSLGSVVLYDLFNNKPSVENDSESEFPIRPSAIFFVGSPVALFQTIRDPSVSDSPRHVVNLPCRVFNVFHPYDAIAYRIEPLIDQKMKDVEPVLIPHRGGHRVHVAIKKSVADIRNAIASFSEWVYTSTSTTQPQGSSQANNPSLEREEIRFVKMMNYNERIDYALQESAVESVSEWVSAVGSHFTYWRHEDVYNFIVHKLIFITKNRSNLNFI
jgi:hypothetical protein